MASGNKSYSNEDSTDLSLTAIIKALDSGSSSPDAKNPEVRDPFDPNATMNYQQAGAPYPELPFAFEDNEEAYYQDLQDTAKGPSYLNFHDNATGASYLNLYGNTKGASYQNYYDDDDDEDDDSYEDTYDYDVRGASRQSRYDDEDDDSFEDFFDEDDEDQFNQYIDDDDDSYEDALDEFEDLPRESRRNTPSRSTRVSHSDRQPSSRRRTSSATSRHDEDAYDDLAEEAPRSASLKNPLKSLQQNLGTARSRIADSRSKRMERLDTPPARYAPVSTNQTYKIRGGGRAQQSLRSPIYLIASVLLVALGIGIFVYGMNTLSSAITEGPTSASFDLTTAQTREAIDSRVPVLLSYIDTDIEDTISIIGETGQHVTSNDRYQPDSPDGSAAGSEMVSMPIAMSEEQMAGYYGGSYNAFTIEELTQYFNGSYVLDMARGDLGSWDKLKYVNLNAVSIEDEMNHLADLQGLSGDSVTVADRGVDSRGNRVIQGQKVVDGERVLYFKIAACLFDDVYNAESLSEASVYITCTLATYDFFTGSDVITAS